MGKFFIRLSFLFVFQCQFINGFAQVNVQDSLALVALYNNTGGVNWTDHTNWLTTPVAQWYGVDVVGNRVYALSLSNNNLVGPLPNQVCDFTALRYWYFDNNKISGTFPSCIGSAVSSISFFFRNNNLTGAISNDFLLMPMLTDVMVSNNDFDVFPDLTSMYYISNLAIDRNRFTFEDIEANLAIRNIGYAYYPQDSVSTTENIVVNLNDNFNFTVTIGGANNTYQWYKNGQALINNAIYSGVETPTLNVSNAQFSEEGDYTCRIKNTAAIFLTLQSRVKKMTIFDTRLDQTLTILNNDTILCNQDSIKVLANSSVGLPYLTEIMGNSEVAFLSNDTMVVLGQGEFQLRVYNNGDATYKPASSILTIKIIPSESIPLITIENNLPVEVGDLLSLAVPSITNYNYKWDTPGGVLTDIVSFEISNIQETDSGIYGIEIRENKCLVGSATLDVKVKKFETVLVIYELITPNGDGKNDVFYIENLETSPNTEVSIYNAWNQVVFHSTQYKNDWDGGNLPVGNYFYSIREFDCRCETHKGTLYIKR